MILCNIEVLDVNQARCAKTAVLRRSNGALHVLDIGCGE